MSVPLTSQQEALAQELAQAIQQAATDDILQMARMLVATDERQLFGNTEFQIRDLALQIAAKVYNAHLAEKKNGYEGSSVCCPHCDYAAAYHGDRPRQLLSLFGRLSCKRAYYLCRRCGQGLCPWDQTVGLTARNLTPAVERLTALAGGVCESFEKGGELLEEMASVSLSEATVERTTEAVGGRIAAALGQGRTFGAAEDWCWHPDAKGRLVAYVSHDATGVRQQAAGGGCAEGRMVNVGMIYNPPPGEHVAVDPDKPRPRLQARYLAGLYTLAEMGPLLRRQGGQVGMNRAELWIALTDGGNGLEDFILRNFPLVAVVILDFWHAAEYLADLARAVHPEDEEAASLLRREWCRVLKEEGGAVTLAVLREWEWPSRKPAVRAQLAKVEQYFENHLHRMDYPEYVAEGWQIGSGPVESACKTVVGQRLKLAGMRWSEEGTHTVCQVRALYRSEKGQWSAFWERDYAN